MRKKFGIIILISIIVSSLFFICTGKKITAEECNDCDPISTEPGDAEFPENWNCACNPYEPMILEVVYDPSYPDTIKCGLNIIIKVFGGCSTFSGEVYGTGYSLSKIGEREFSLSCNSSCACGDESGKVGAVATVTVTDSCGKNSNIEIRNTSGKWVPSDVICGGLAANYNQLYGEPVGKYRYFVSLTLIGLGRKWSCDGGCASYIIANQGSLGFPEAGYFFSCYQNNFYVQDLGWAGSGWTLYLREEEWRCK